MQTRTRRRILWIGAALVGAVVAVLWVPGWIEKREIPQRLRSREESERVERGGLSPERDRTPSLRYETKGIKVTFHPVEEEPRRDENEVRPPNRFDRYPGSGGALDAVQ